ncbi:uncharacterized protein LOC121861061 [Homarus americanus]|nr:uncharacterized protein LOC121861061 [Homarus americanus]
MPKKGECGVCFTKYKEGDVELCPLACGHILCSSCTTTLIQKSSNAIVCPFCQGTKTIALICDDANTAAQSRKPDKKKVLNRPVFLKSHPNVCLIQSSSEPTLTVLSVTPGGFAVKSHTELPMKSTKKKK